MNPKGVRKSEQIKLIMECRCSGLSDYQWCQNRGINTGTFYNWVSKLRKAGYMIPDSESRTSAISVEQEVVKLEMVEFPVFTPVIVEQNASNLTPSTLPEKAAEIEYGYFKVGRCKTCTTKAYEQGWINNIRDLRDRLENNESGKDS